MRLLLGFLGAALLWCPVVSAASTPDAALRAGAAMVDITPTQASLGPTDTVRDSLFVRAIVVEAGSSCAVLVGVDTGGLGERTATDTIRKAAEETGCPVQNFVISATHTHSASADRGRTPLAASPDIQLAIVTAVREAKAALRPARIGFAQTEVHLNVNRDLFEHGRWKQGANPAGPSDKTLAVLALVGEDGRPIGAYLNYAMHPINFYLSGVISADFAGEASRYVERRYGPAMVVIFAQGASGDQNPLLTRPQNRLSRIRTGVAGTLDLRVGQVAPLAEASASMERRLAALALPVPQEILPDYRSAIDEVSALIKAEGTLLGESAVDLIQSPKFELAATGTIRGSTTTFACLGRDRLDLAHPIREGDLPPYADGSPVELRVGVLRIADVHIATVNAEVYSEIGSRLKREAPVQKLMMTTLANGAANSGYVYSDAARNHLTFQVIGSRLKPGCAETQIANTALTMIDGIASKSGR